jgi:HSP20 family molecular chaperone IbpA
MASRTWNPFTEMYSLRDAMNQLMEESFVRPGASAIGAAQASYAFPLNIFGTNDELKVEALLPGISEEDVRVDVDRGVLTIAAKRHCPGSRRHPVHELGTRSPRLLGDQAGWRREPGQPDIGCG